MKFPSTRSLGIALMLVSLLPLSHSARLYSAQAEFMEQSVVRRATVVEHRLVPRLPGKPASNEIQSIVSFTDDHGEHRQAPSNVSSYPAAHTVGEEIEIRVHTANPTDVRVVSFTGLWFETAFYLIPGLLALAGGTSLVLRARRRTLGRHA